MIINIIVSDNYNNNKLIELLELNDPNINENILNFGTTTFLNQEYIIKNDNTYLEQIKQKEKIIENLSNQYANEYIAKIREKEKIIENLNNAYTLQYEDKIKELNQIINKLKNEKITDIEELIDKGKRITEHDYEKILYLHNKQNIELKEKNDELYNKIDILNRKIIEISKYKDESNYNNISQNLDILNNKFSSYFEKIFRENTAKGAFGENFIQNYLSDKFSNSQIINTSKETACGDITFIFDNLNLLIESKNVQTLKKDDIDKFYRDIDVRSAKNDINSALLVSLNDTNLVNGHRIFHFEIKNNIPIIMISNVFNNNEFIRMAIIILNNLIKKNMFQNNFDNDEEKISILIKAINQLFDNIKQQISLLEHDKSLINKLQESYNKREAEIFNTNKIFTELFSKIPNIWKTNENKDKDKDNDKILNDIIDKINIKYQEDPNFIISIKNIEALGFSNSIIKKIGGIRKISSQFNNITL
jgi:hypothetical protein